jgi:hypothetical protein
MTDDAAIDAARAAYDAAIDTLAVAEGLVRDDACTLTHAYVAAADAAADAAHAAYVAALDASAADAALSAARAAYYAARDDAAEIAARAARAIATTGEP